MEIQSQYRLPVFLALSLAIHLIWFVKSQSYSFHPPQQDNSQMAVHISESRPPGHTQKKPLITEKTLTKKPDTLTEHKSQPRSQSSQQAFNQVTRAKILGHVRHKLVQYFVYPRLARRQGWQGQVLLEFQVDSAGSIQHVHVKQSSGYAILDDSAIAAMSKIGNIGLRESDFLNRVWLLEIPVIYRLEG